MRHILRLCACIGALALLSTELRAAQACRVVFPQENLQAAIDETPRKGCLLLTEGTFSGPVRLTKPIRIQGTDQTEIRGNQKGSTVTVSASRVTLDRLKITGFGADLSENNAGVEFAPFTHTQRLENLKIEGPGFGVFIPSGANFTVQSCTIAGDASRPITKRGDGIYAKSAQNILIQASTVHHTRDGIYLESTSETAVIANQFNTTQYGVHFMYAKNGRAERNTVSESTGGIAVMSTKAVEVVGNRVVSGTEFGILLNVADGCRIESNRVTLIRNPQGEALIDNAGKALFLYGQGTNRITANQFEQSDIGVDASVGTERNLIWKNSFAQNCVSARYTGTDSFVWTAGEKGNYWGSGTVVDLDGDGVAEDPYRPNNALDRLFWLYPEIHFLAGSPAVQLMRRILSTGRLGSSQGIIDRAALSTFSAGN